MVERNIMYLKKFFIQVPFSNKKAFDIVYFDEVDLKNGVLKLCNQLKKDFFLIQVFSRDELNELLCIDSSNFFKYKNFNYYLTENLHFLHNLSFEKLRFLNIYAMNEEFILTNLNQLKKIEEHYAFQIGFDNYLEYVEIIINYNYYDKKMINNILKLWTNRLIVKPED